jgi:uncharacterized protein YceH (UPF0502 family)
MRNATTRLACALALAGAMSACTILGVETESTTTEYKQETGIESRIDRLESQLQSLERRLDDHIRAGQR